MKPILSGTGKVRGYILETKSRKQITDLSGKLLGWYDHNQDITFNRQGQNIGKGDQTMSLLEN